MDESAIRGLRWTFLSFVASRVFSLASLIVLARLLAPEDFGLVAFALLASALLALAVTAGIGPALVVSPSLSKAQLGVSLSMLITLNGACAVVLAAVSPAAGALIGGSNGAGVIAAMGMPLLLRGVSSFYSALLQRELLFARRAAIQIADVLIGGAVAVSFAVAGAGVWSLVAGQTAGALAGSLTSIWVAPVVVRPSFDAEAAREIFRSGHGFVWQTGASFVEQNADYFVVGSMLGSAPLGYYSMAYRLSELPYNSLVEPVAQVTFPGFARMRARGQEVAGPFLTLLRISALCAFPLGLILSGAASPFVDAIFGPKWTDMTAVLGVLGVWGSFRTIHATIAWFVNSTGYAGEVGKSYALILIVALPLVVVAGTISVEAVAVVMTANVITMSLVVGNIARRRLEVSAKAQWLAIRSSLLGGAVAWLSAGSISMATEAVSPGVSLLLALTGGFAAYAIVILVTDRGAVGQVRAQLVKILRRSSPARHTEPFAEHPHV